MAKNDKEVRDQVGQVAADLGPGPQPSAENLGAAAAAAGAVPGEVDAGALLAQIRAMQQRLDTLEAEKKLESGPEVVKYATAVADHLAAKAAATPHPDHGLAEGVTLAAALPDAAAAAADGDTSALEKPLAEVTAWVRKTQARLPHLDFSYILQLADEAADAAARLAA